MKRIAKERNEAEAEVERLKYLLSDLLILTDLATLNPPTEESSAPQL